MRQDLIALGKNYRGTPHHDGARVVLNKRGKDWCNLALGRDIENQQAQPESTGRRLHLLGLRLIIHSIGGDRPRNHLFTRSPHFLWQPKALFWPLPPRISVARDTSPPPADEC